ncbi:MAG: hypothetical protein IH624_04120 [Phycisphaerae bacterium]|nr:hypothetical protein [Phycisphaerae bacterium]
MSRKAYKRKTGEFEIRILPDGRVVMLAPDETLMDIARAVENQQTQTGESEKGTDVRTSNADGPGGE